MKLVRYLPVFVVLAGCSSQTETPAPTAAAGLSAEQNLEKVKNDPKIPDGLKQIQAKTLEAQAGVKR